MINLPAVEYDHVLTAIEQFEAAGGQALLAAHGADKSEVLLHHNGREFDGTVVMGLAHGLATGFTPDPGQLKARASQVARALDRLGFAVLGPAPSAPAARAPRSRSRATTATKRTPEPVKVAICPTCFMALPATGICDNCD